MPPKQIRSNIPDFAQTIHQRDVIVQALRARLARDGRSTRTDLLYAYLEAAAWDINHAYNMWETEQAMRGQPVQTVIGPTPPEATTMSDQTIAYGGQGQQRKPPRHKPGDIVYVANAPVGEAPSLKSPSLRHEGYTIPRGSISGSILHTSYMPPVPRDTTPPESIPGVSWRVIAVRPSATENQPHQYTIEPVKPPRITAVEGQLVAKGFNIDDQVVKTSNPARGGYVVRGINLGKGEKDELAVVYLLKDEFGLFEDDVPGTSLRLADRSRNENFFPIGD